MAPDSGGFGIFCEFRIFCGFRILPLQHSHTHTRTHTHTHTHTATCFSWLPFPSPPPQSSPPTCANIHPVHAVLCMGLPPPPPHPLGTSTHPAYLHARLPLPAPTPSPPGTITLRIFTRLPLPPPSRTSPPGTDTQRIFVMNVARTDGLSNMLLVSDPYANIVFSTWDVSAMLGYPFKKFNQLKLDALMPPPYNAMHGKWLKVCHGTHAPPPYTTMHDA